MGHNSAIFEPIGLKYFVGAQETFIYRLVMRNQNYGAYFPFLIFWATFGEKMGVATTQAPDDPAPTGWTVLANCYLENVFSKNFWA